MKSGRATSREIVGQYLMRMATLRGSPERGDRREPAGARGSGRARSRARAGQDARPAARHPGRAQGQHPHHQHADDRRRAGVRRLHAAVRSDADEEPARRRRDHHRQDRADRAGELGGRRARRRCPATTTRSAASASTRTTRGPIRATRAFDGRPVLQTGGSSSGVGTAANFWAAQRRHRHRRIGHQPVERQHARRHPPDDRPHQPLRRDPDHRRSRHRRADDEDRGRRGDHARRAGRRGARSATTPATQHVHAAAGPRLHEVPQRRRPARARASACRARSTTIASTLPGEDRRRAAASTPSRPR